MGSRIPLRCQRSVPGTHHTSLLKPGLVWLKQIMTRESISGRIWAYAKLGKLLLWVPFQKTEMGSENPQSKKRAHVATRQIRAPACSCSSRMGGSHERPSKIRRFLMFEDSNGCKETLRVAARQKSTQSSTRQNSCRFGGCQSCRFGSPFSKRGRTRNTCRFCTDFLVFGQVQIISDETPAGLTHALGRVCARVGAQRHWQRAEFLRTPDPGSRTPGLEGGGFGLGSWCQFAGYGLRFWLLAFGVV